MPPDMGVSMLMQYLDNLGLITLCKVKLKAMGYLPRTCRKAPAVTEGILLLRSDASHSQQPLSLTAGKLITNLRPKSRIPVLTTTPSFLQVILNLTSGLEEKKMKRRKREKEFQRAWCLIQIHILFQGYGALRERRDTSVILIKSLNWR